MGYLQLLKTFGPYILVALAVSWLTHAVDTGKIERAKAEAAQEHTNYVTAKKANDNNVQTIEDMKKDRASVAKTCREQLNAKDELISEYRDIDSQEGGNDVKSSETGTADAVLTGLNGMFPAVQ